MWIATRPTWFLVTFLVGLIAGFALRVSACRADEPLKWVLIVSWPSHDITQLQLFPDGCSCITQLNTIRKIYEGKGTLACALKWDSTKS